MEANVKKGIGKSALAITCVIALFVCLPVLAEEQSSSAVTLVPEESHQTGNGSGSNDSDALTEILSLAPSSVVSSDATSAAPQPEAKQNDDLAPDSAAPETSTHAGDPSSASGEFAKAIPVIASSPTGVSQADKPANSTRGIEEIVVTATKREESLRDIPASISAFNGADLENQGKINLNDYIQQTPGVVASSSNPGVIRISVRGISTDTSPLSPQPSPVGIFIGDTAFTDPYLNSVTPDLNAFDLAGVQILKGPQGTLFGGAALSGAIRYVLQDPVQGEWQFRSFAQYSAVDEGGQALTSGALVNVPLLKDQNLAMRLGYVRRNYPGTYDNVRTGENNVDRGSGNQFRGLLAWQPTDELKLKYTHLNQDFSTADSTTLSDTPHGKRQTNNILFKQPLRNSFSLDSVEVNYDFDSVRLVSLTSHINKDIYNFADVTTALVGRPPAGYPTALGAFEFFDDKSSAWAQEVRLQSTGDGSFKWLVGGYFYAYKVHFGQVLDTFANQEVSGPGSLLASLPGGLGSLISTANIATSLLYDYCDAKSQEHAIFFDLSDTLWDRLDVSAGARFYSTFVDGGFIGKGVVPIAVNNGNNIDQRNRLTEKGVSPKFSATYHFSDEISLYSSASRGFRFGGLQLIPATPTNGVPATYKSDSLWNYETGLRTSWLENTLHADITGFFIDYKNPQVQQSTQTIGLAYYNNVGSAQSKGFEASLLWMPPISGLMLSLQGGLTDAHTTESFKSSSGKIIAPGTQMPGAAKSQYSGSIQYALPLGWIDLGSSVSYTYIGKGFSNLDHDNAVNDYGALSAGLSMGSQALSMHPQLTLNVSNVLNVATPIAGATYHPTVGGAFSEYTLTPPRTISIRLSLDI